MKIAIVILSIIVASTLSIHSAKLKKTQAEIPRISIMLPNKTTPVVLENLEIIDSSLNSTLGLKFKAKDGTKVPEVFLPYFAQDEADVKQGTYTLPFTYIRNILTLGDNGLFKYDFATFEISPNESEDRATFRIYFPLIKSKNIRAKFMSNLQNTLGINSQTIGEIKHKIAKYTEEYKLNQRKKASSLLTGKDKETQKQKVSKSIKALENEKNKTKEQITKKQDEIETADKVIWALKLESWKLNKQLKEKEDQLEREQASLKILQQEASLSKKEIEEFTTNQQKALEHINLGIDTLNPFVDPKRIENIKDLAKNTKIEELQNAVNEI